MAQLLIPSILPLNNTFTGSNTYALTAIPSTVEVFATYSISDDATGRMYIENSTVSDNSYTPQIRGVTGGTTRGMVILGQGTTDSGSTPLLEFRGRIGTVTNATTRPLFTWTNNLTTRAVMSANGNLTLGATAGTAASAIYVTTVNSIYSLLTTTSNATLSVITGGLTIAGNLVSSAYVNNGYTAGITWSSTDDNAGLPKGGVFLQTTAAGSVMVFGTSNAYGTGMTSYVNIDQDGQLITNKINVGTTSPTASQGSAFTINSDLTTGAAGSGSIIIQGAANKERIKIYSAGGAGTGGPLFNMFSFRGSIASPTATQNGDLLSGISGGGYGATGYSGNQYIFLQYATENWTDSAQGTYTAFNSVANGTTSSTARLLINHDGSITLGAAFGTGTGALYAGAGTFTGLLTTVASATGSAGLRIPHGTAPSSPTNGDMWTTTAGLYVRINGVTKTVTLT